MIIKSVRCKWKIKRNPDQINDQDLVPKSLEKKNGGISAQAKLCIRAENREKDKNRSIML